MDEYHHSLILRLFGPSAVLGGDWCGDLRIVVDGVTVGTGSTLETAIAAASTVLSVVVRLQR